MMTFAESLCNRRAGEVHGGEVKIKEKLSWLKSEKN
jgi:hypothetical protein